MAGNKRQIILSIIGIIVLIIAVVGVSFAFFSYSKTGTSNNVITTGQIFLAYEEVEGISLTNQFPMLDSEAQTEILTGDASDVSELDFTVTGYYSSATGGIDYTVYAIDGGAVAGKVNKFADSEISVFLTDYPSAYSEAVVNTPTPVSSLTSDANGYILAVGHINAGTTLNNQQVDSYTLRMFVNDTVRISDTNTTVPFTGAKVTPSATKYCASARSNDGTSGCQLYLDDGVLTSAVGLNDTSSITSDQWLKVYSTLYYSLKLKVVGNQ